MSWKALGLGVAVVLVWLTGSVTPGRAMDGNELLQHCTGALRYVEQGHQSLGGNELMQTAQCGYYLDMTVYERDRARGIQ
jgi:hypothetical protein